MMHDLKSEVNETYPASYGIALKKYEDDKTKLIHKHINFNLWVL